MARNLGQSPWLGPRSASHTLVHALEELGEVARLVLQWEGYKQAENTEKLHVELEEELGRFCLPLQAGVSDGCGCGSRVGARPGEGRGSV